MSNDFSEKNYSLKMDKSILSLKKDISTLRTGRANTSMIDTIKVDVYGQLMPINQLATILFVKIFPSLITSLTYMS